MADLLQVLEINRPKELRDNFHAVEEWREDIDSAAKKVAGCFMEAAKCAQVGELEDAAAELEGLKRIRLLRFAFEPSVLSITQFSNNAC